ncbi:unnamed protein product [Scytosiphon promiscuus]
MEKAGLARKLTTVVLLSTAAGLCLILCIYVVLVLEDVPTWGSESQDTMREQEGLNINRLAIAKADHVGEIFARVKENLLQLQAWGGQILLTDPENLVVDEYVQSFSGLQQHPANWKYSTWYISGFTSDTSPPAVGDSLDGLLNRSALMDVPFRGMQRQEMLIYLAALDNPSLPDDPDTSVAFQAYPAYDMLEAGFTTFDDEEDCDDRFATGDSGFTPSTYDPRCRGWFQDARASNVPIFTDPYQDWSSGLLTVTPAAAVYNGTTFLGVVGIDMNFTVIDQSIVSLRVVDEEGYAYLLAPTGVVAAHPDLDPADTPSILDLEPGVDEREFSSLLARMIEECGGTASYQKNGNPWLISWKHETASASFDTGVSSDGASVGCPGFIVVVTVSEATLLGVFSETEAGIRQTVLVASILMAVMMIGIACVTVWLARSLSQDMTTPVTQLVDIVRALNNMDFSRQDPGLWMLNEVSCPEVEELMETFKTMTTVVKFANVSLESGNVEAAYQSYKDALILFKKLKNDRGVAVVYNNLGNVYTLQARGLSKRADTKRECRPRTADCAAEDLKRRATRKYEDAVASFRLAIEDAEMLVSWGNQEKPDSGQVQNDRSLHPTSRTTVDRGGGHKEQEKTDRGCEAGGKASGDPLHVAEAQDAQASNDDEDNRNNDTSGRESAAALKLQLANRKFNLALCLAAKAASGGDNPRKNREMAARETEEARTLICDCEALASERNDALGRERRVEYFLALAALERSQSGRTLQAARALERAQEIVATAGGQEAPASGLSAVPGDPTADAAAVPLAILRQRVLAARGEERIAVGDVDAAVGYWTEAVVGCDLLDSGAVRTSLIGIREQAPSLGDAHGGGNPFAMALARGLGLAKEGEGVGGRVIPNSSLTKRIEAEIVRLERSTACLSSGDTVKVDLCFVMDCTGSMSRWIDQAKKKLFAIIEQTKKDIENLELRVAYIGYRDFRDNKRHFEGPYDFHSEEELPQLEAKLSGIRAGGGPGFVADVAGGIKHATQLSWCSPVRLCILFADAPCHGTKYHNQPDPNPQGCPRGVDPAKMIYKLQYELNVDFYFIRIASVTDKMVSIFQNTVRLMASNNEKKLSKREDSAPKFVVHNLGSDDNSFVDTVVGSVIVSAGINLRMEKYA